MTFTSAMPRYLQTAGKLLRLAARNVAGHADAPGYRQLPWLSRCRLNLQSFVMFLCSAACLHVFCALTIWLLVSYIVIWTNDLVGPAAAWLPSAALFWLLPWLGAIRRRRIAELLGGRWEQSKRHYG